MGAGASVPEEIPESVEAALAKGFTQEQIDAYQAEHPAAEEAAAPAAEEAAAPAAHVETDECKHNVSAFGGTVSGDCKDTDTFKYFTYPALPTFTDKHKSAMSRLLTAELWEQLKDKKTATGYSHVYA